MNKTIRVLIFVFVLGLAFASAVWLYVFNKPHRNIANEKADYIVNAHELFLAFTENEKQANAKFLGKAVEVYGLVHEVSSKTTLIVYSEGTAENGVQCEMDTKHKQTTDGIVVGQKIKLRGQCDGLLLDVLLSKAVVVK